MAMPRYQFTLTTALIVLVGTAAGIGALALYYEQFTPQPKNLVLTLTVGALVLGLSEYLRARRKPPGSKG